MCDETDRKLDYGADWGGGKKESEGWWKNAKCPALFCLIVPLDKRFTPSMTRYDT